MQNIRRELEPSAVANSKKDAGSPLPAINTTVEEQLSVGTINFILRNRQLPAKGNGAEGNIKDYLDHYILSYSTQNSSVDYAVTPQGQATVAKLSGNYSNGQESPPTAKTVLKFIFDNSKAK